MSGGDLVKLCTSPGTQTAGQTNIQVRLVGLDRLRGLAILLMVVDHVVHLIEPTHFLGRFTITRAAMPLFCIIAGSLSKDRPNWERLTWVTLAGLVATFFGFPLGIGQPDILLVLAFGLMLLPYGAAWPLLALCIIAPSTWNYPYSGYSPHLVMALLIVGKLLVDPAQLNKAGDFLPGFFAVLGRWPLTIYIVHLFALWLLYIW